MRLSDLPLHVYLAALAVFMVAPIALIIIGSVNASDYIHFPPSGFSLKHYHEAMADDRFLSAFQTSVITALASSGLALVLGAPAAVGLTRYEFPARGFIQAFLMSPLMIPSLVIGITLLHFYSALRLPQSTFTIIAGHLIITLPFTVRLLIASLLGFDRRLEQAATSLGASPVKAFLTITLPNISAGVMAAFTFAAIMSFDDVGLALFIAPSQKPTLPVAIFTYLDQNYDPMIMAVSTFTILLSVVLVLVLDRLVGVSRVFMNMQSR